MRRSGIRAAAWAAIAGQAAFVGSWALAGALQDHYSHLEQGVSDLAGLTARHAWIVQAGFVVFGLSLAALVPGLRALLPRRRAATATALLFLLAGAGFVLVAFFRLDCSLAASDACADRFHAGLLSWHTSAHLWAGLVAEVALVGTPFALARALWPRFAGGAALAVGGSGIAIGTATAIAYAVAAGATPDGLVERLELGFAQAWIV